MDLINALSEQQRWESTILDEIFKALASSQDLSRMLIYKGARVLRLRLQESLRASFDIDACLTNFAANTDGNSRSASLDVIKMLANRAIIAYFEAQEPVRYELLRVSLANRRKIGPHPRAVGRLLVGFGSTRFGRAWRFRERGAAIAHRYRYSREDVGQLRFAPHAGRPDGSSFNA